MKHACILTHAFSLGKPFFHLSTHGILILYVRHLLHSIAGMIGIKWRPEINGWCLGIQLHRDGG